MMLLQRVEILYPASTVSLRWVVAKWI